MKSTKKHKERGKYYIGNMLVFCGVGHLLHVPYSFKYVSAWGCGWVGGVSLVSLKLDVLMEIRYIETSRGAVNAGDINLVVVMC